MNKNKNGTYFCRLFEPSTDLIKQLYALAGCIEHHIENNYHIIILDDFFYHKPVPVSSVIDIQRLLLYLYNPSPFSLLQHPIKTLEIVDKKNLNFKLISIIYGNEIKFDLTSNFDIKNNILDIYQGLLDKAIEKKKYQEIGEKKLLIKYSLNNRTIEQTFIIKNDRSLTEKDRILLDYSISTFIPSPILRKEISKNPALFVEILKNIRFHDSFYKVIDKIIPIGDINIIDLKLENDISTYSKEFGVDENEFRERIETKYIEMIKKYIDRGSTTILLTNSISNRVISYLSDESYSYLLSCKMYEEIDTSEIKFNNINHSFPKFINIPLKMLEPISLPKVKEEKNTSKLKMLDPVSLPDMVKFKEIKPDTIIVDILDILDNLDVPPNPNIPKISIPTIPTISIPTIPDVEILNICLALKCTNVFIGVNSSLSEYMLDICKNEKTYLFNYNMGHLIVEDCKNKEKEWKCLCF